MKSSLGSFSPPHKPERTHWTITPEPLPSKPDAVRVGSRHLFKQAPASDTVCLRLQLINVFNPQPWSGFRQLFVYQCDAMLTSFMVRAAYQSAVEEAVRAFWIKPDIFQLPRPENGQAIWGEEATQLAPRFSVAHGLSHPVWEWPDERYPSDMGPINIDPVKPRPINPAHEDDG